MLNNTIIQWNNANCLRRQFSHNTDLTWICLDEDCDFEDKRWFHCIMGPNWLSLFEKSEGQSGSSQAFLFKPPFLVYISNSGSITKTKIYHPLGFLFHKYLQKLSGHVRRTANVIKYLSIWKSTFRGFCDIELVLYQTKVYLGSWSVHVLET